MLIFMKHILNVKGMYTPGLFSIIAFGELIRYKQILPFIITKAATSLMHIFTF